MRELTPDPFPFEFYVDYLNTPEVMSAIGAFVGFSESNDAVSTAFGATGDDNREDGTVGKLLWQFKHVDGHVSYSTLNTLIIYRIQRLSKTF
jgi:hypothetical protein